MRLASYLSASRHGIFYIRYPVPSDCHPERKRGHVKVSLGTREPREARHLSRLLALAGQSVLTQSKVRAMRYDEMREHVREHFSNLLRDFRERTAADGPAGGLRHDALRAAQGFAEGDSENWASLAHPAGTDGLLRAFCKARGISFEPAGDQRALMLSELQKGYREYVAQALAHTAQFDTLLLEEAPRPAQHLAPAPANSAQIDADALPYAEVVSRYFEELKRTNALVAKTEDQKRDALKLLSALTSDKPLAEMSKTDAQKVKAALFKLPKNRNKNEKTRDLPLGEMLELQGVNRISARTMNVYLGHMQSLFTWAVNNGYAADNPFVGMRIKNTNKTQTDGRTAFTTAQLRLMFSHLTDPNSLLVKKDVHKWPALIGMFTGMRLNEIAQLEVQDIAVHDEVWCFDVTPNGDAKKRLKNASSKRRVPVHDKLVASGFLEFYEAQKNAGQTRLFPELTYSAQNGYGRNAGRWFNERFLPELGFSDEELVFHCLRHTMVTRLAQAGVEEPLLKALVGHSQTGVTFSTYFKEGFLPSQLKAAIDRFEV